MNLFQWPIKNSAMYLHLNGNKKLAIIVSHPIQYFSPLFKELSKKVELVVFYGYQPSSDEQGKRGFDTSFNWDVDLFEGYKYVFLENVSKSNSYQSFNSINVPSIGKIISNHGCTHVIIFGWQYKFYLQALIYCKRHSIPVGVRGDSQTGMTKSLLKKLIKKVFYPIFLNLYDKLFYVGARNYQYYKYYFVPDKKLIFSPHAVDQNFWHTSNSNCLRRKNSITEFVWIGKMIDKKRPHDVLEAFKKLDDLNLSLKIIGSGRLLDECRRKYNELSNVTFLGFKNQKELKKLYSESDCIILTSDARETWGLVINEAFACCIPAIVSDACGCSPDLININTGRTFPVGNVEELVNKIIELTKAVEESPDSFRHGITEKNQIYNYENVISSFETFLSEEL